MPKSAVQRRMGDGWLRLMDRGSVAAQSLPPEGVTRARFVDAVFEDVEPGEIDAVLKAMHTRKLAWVSRRDGAIRIYRERPKSEPGERVSESPVARFLSLVAPHFHGLASIERERMAARAKGDWMGSAEAHDRIRAHAHRILATCRMQADRGLQVDVIRKALHETFAEDALAALVYYEPRLQAGALDDDLSLAESVKTKRSPKGLTVDDRVLRLIQKAGEAGITHTSLTRAIRPLLPSSAIREATERLAARGLTSTRTVKVAAGRPGERHFATG